MLRNPLIEKSIIHSEYLNEDIINLGNQSFMIPEEFSFTVIDISKDFIARPDLISQQIYGYDMYQDVICKLNGISNPFELNEGDRLIIPDANELYKFYYSPSKDELIDNEDKNLPTPKKKQEKRKANEALIGDERFKIDSKNRVIIY